MHMAKKWTEMFEKQLLIIPHLFHLITVQFFFRLSVSIHSLFEAAILVKSSYYIVPSSSTALYLLQLSMSNYPDLQQI